MIKAISSIITLTYLILSGFSILMAQAIHGIGTPDEIGVLGESTGKAGVFGTSTSSYGVQGSGIFQPGIYGTSQKHAGVLGVGIEFPGVMGQSDLVTGVAGYSNKGSGVFGNSTYSVAVSGISDEFHGSKFQGGPGFADIVLEGSNYLGGNDDGVIMSDPDLPGSDIFLASNDAVIIELDKNGDETGNFEIWNGVGDKVFRLTDNGQTEIWANFSFPPVSLRTFLLERTGNLTISGTLTEGSDRNRKENIRSIDQSEILNKLLDIPVSSWNYIGDDTPHVGPMAQDFYDAFRLGSSDTGISGIDMQGVLLAAIQAQQGKIENLHELLLIQNQTILSIEKEISELKIQAKK